MNIVGQIKEKMKEEIRQAAVRAGLASADELPDVLLEVPRDKAHGDYSTNIAMQLARIAKKPPRAIAEAIVGQLDRERMSVARIEIAGPGFINFYMDNRYLTAVVPTILQAGQAYGESNVGDGE
ncbi:arginine--tRNA ligase, partial [Geobacillus sp. T6]